MAEAPVVLTITPTPAVHEEVSALLPRSKGKLGAVATCQADGITSLADLVAQGAAANVGAASNTVAMIDAIRDGHLPPAPSRAALTLSAARSFLKQHRERLSPEARDYIERVIDALSDVRSDPTAQQREDSELEDRSAELEVSLEHQGGVYAYSFPHYLRHPTIDDTDRTLIKVGMTNRDATTRVREQAKGAAIPEDPQLLRVYTHPDRTPEEIERDFHRLLRGADHSVTREIATSREWFETSLDYLDTIAEVLGLEIQRNAAD